MLTAVVLARNEEKNIDRCLSSLKWCDEIIVIDDNSHDKTQDIAKSYEAKILGVGLDNNFAKQRTIGLQHAKHSWVLFVDADEEVSQALKHEIEKVTAVANNDYDGYYIPRKDHMWGKILLHGETGNIKVLRLGKKEKGEWGGMVHETWNIKGNIGALSEQLDHFPHPSIVAFLEKINFYTDIRSQELFKKGVKTNALLIIVYPMGKFVQNYLLKSGYLDGIPGFLHAMLMSFHSFLTRSKLWLLWHKK